MKKSDAFGARSTADEVLAGIDLTGKRYLVTGGTSGLGLQVASALAANGGHVVVTARTFDRARRACEEIGYHCSPLQCDLGDLDGIAAATAAVHGLGGPLDAIIAHAAIAPPETLSLRNGVEAQFFVNHVGHFALINDLTDLLRDGAGRVVIVSSSVAGANAARGGIMFDNLAGERFYEAQLFHRQSALANALYAKELSRRLSSRSVAVNCVDPGTVRPTARSRHWSVVRRLLQFAARPFLRSPAQGAATSSLLAASPDVAGVSGEHWRFCKVAPSNPLIEDRELAVRLWDLCADIVARHRVLRAGMMAHAA